MSLRIQKLFYLTRQRSSKLGVYTNSLYGGVLFFLVKAKLGSCWDVLFSEPKAFQFSEAN